MAGGTDNGVFGDDDGEETVEAPSAPVATEELDGLKR